MKHLYLLILFVTFYTAMFGVSGHITTNTIWDTDTIVTGDLWVDESVTLTINPGVNVFIPKVDQNADSIGDVDIIINGRLICSGTVEQKVRFISMEAVPGKKDWAGFTFSAASSQNQSNLNNTDIFNAYRGILINGVGIQASGVKVFYGEDYGVRIQNTTSLTRFTNSIVEEISVNGMTIEAGSVTLTDVSISHNGGYGLKALNPVTLSATRLSVVKNINHGLWLENTQSAVFSDSRFNSNTQNGINIDRMSPSFSNCQINNNQQTGVYVFGNAGTPVFVNCTLADNACGLQCISRPVNMTYCNIEGNAYGIYIYRTNPTINFCNITNNGIGSSNELTYNLPSQNAWRTTSGGVQFPVATYNAINPTAHPMYITSLTYLKDGDYYNGGSSSSYRYYRNYTRLWCNNETLLIDEYVVGGNYLQHDMPQVTVSGNLNKLLISRTDLSLDLYNSENCPNPRAWVTQIKYFLGYSCAVYNLAGTTAMINSNWWGQITGVDSLVYQSVAGTANYEGIMVSRISSAGCNLPNVAPTIQILSPAALQINPASTTISWICRDFDSNADISLYYNSEPTTDGNLIVADLPEDSSTSYTWNFTDTPLGQYYIYAKIDDGENPAAYAFAPGQVMVGPLTIKIEDCFAAAGDTIVVPIKAYNAYNAYDLNAFQLTVGYTHTLLTYLDTVVTGTMVEDWTVNSNGNLIGQVSINGFNADTLDGNGDLIKLRFRVVAQAADMQNTNITISNFQYNNGNPVPVITSGTFTVRNRYNMNGWTKYYSNNNPIQNVEISATGFASGTSTSNSTGFFAFPNFYYGDYQLNPVYNGTIPELLVTPYDASMIARYALGLITLNANQVTAGNVDADADVDIYDAAQIARYCVGLIAALPSGVMKFSPVSHSFLLSSAYTPRTFNGIAIGDVSGNWGTTRPDLISPNVAYQIEEDADRVYLRIQYPESFYSLYCKLPFDTSALEFAEYTFGNGVTDMNATINSADGELILAAFGAEAVSGNPDIITIVFDKTDIYEMGDLMVDFIIFDENLGSPSAVDEVILPATTSLHQNYPNPFNPETNISFYLTTPQQVKVEIFNLKGQLVQTLVNGALASGNHRILWDASQCGSGVYFARLQTAEGYKKTVKMILMK